MITKQEIQPVITKKVVITDSLFASYVNAIAEHLLPYQWKVLNDQIPGAEKSHCIDNFRIAAGEMEGTHQGAVFQDTDLYTIMEGKILPNSLPHFVTGSNSRHKIPILKLYNFKDSCK